MITLAHRVGLSPELETPQQEGRRPSLHHDSWPSPSSHPPHEWSCGMQTDLPWEVQIVQHSGPILDGDVDVVQAGLRAGLRAVEQMRVSRLPIGSVLCCLTHSLIHIPVERGMASRWSCPLTQCRPHVFTCTMAAYESAYRRCVRIWMMPPAGAYLCTDGVVFHHRLAVARCADSRTRAVLDDR